MSITSLFRFGSGEIDVAAVQLSALDVLTSVRAAHITTALRHGDRPDQVRAEWRQLIDDFRTAAEVVRTTRGAVFSGEPGRTWTDAYMKMAAVLEQADVAAYAPTPVQASDVTRIAGESEEAQEVAALATLTAAAADRDRARRGLLSALERIAPTAKGTSQVIATLIGEVGVRNIGSPAWR